MAYLSKNHFAELFSISLALITWASGDIDFIKYIVEEVKTAQKKKNKNL
jgi:hypothetical protein